MPQKKTPRKTRIDLLLCEQGLAPTREKAQALVMAGQVKADGQRVDKPGALVPLGAALQVDGGLRFVSRGGLKLAHALHRFRVKPAGWIALDVGSSTGGFTDCLLQQGAVRVYAVDVGKGQLDYRLRKDPRVAVMEGVNAHYPFDLPETANLAVVDVSFISLTKVLPNVTPHVVPGGLLLCLVKPQFEAGRDQVQRGGLVKDPMVHGAVLGNVGLWAIEHRLRVRGITPSPIAGTKGNHEFLMLLEKEAGQGPAGA